MINQEQSIENDFHKHLEETAANRQYVRVHYYSDLQELLRTTQVVKNIAERNGEEYLMLANGEEIPLNKLVRVGNRLAPGHDTDDAYSCDC
jgi:Rho-binding antiterminator